MEKLNLNIFRQYDIRGEYPTEINENTAYIIGRSYGSFLQTKHHKNKCVIGFDNRLSSPSLVKNLIKGILETGCNVVSVGLCTTPMNYCYRFYNQIPGIMVTASHNPKDDNGFKFSFDEFCNARGEMIDEFKNFTLENNFLEGTGIFTEDDSYNIFKEYIFKNISMGDKKLKIVVDLANATASNFIFDIYSKYNNLDIIYLNEKSDGSFPAHHPDPSVESNLEELKQEVIKNKADLGISFDGDEDRCGVIDENGKWYSADLFMIPIVKYLLPTLTNKTILYDVKCSKSLADEINKDNGNSICYRTGASYTQSKMMEDNIEFGGEYSGHIYFNNNMYPSSSGMYCGLKLIEILSKTDKSFSELFENVTFYENYPEERIECSDDTKFLVIEKVHKYCLSKNYPVNNIDGVRVDFEDSWALVRASNTGPNITTRFEAKTKERLETIRNEFLDIIKSSM